MHHCIINIMKKYLNKGWRFSETFQEELLHEENQSLRSVVIPHTCKELPYHYFDETEVQMISLYQRTLEVPLKWKGKQILLTFEGVGHQCEVFLNGQKIAEHGCGYTAFTVHLEDAVKYGQSNLLCVKVDSRECINVPPFGHVIDYLTYGGIYRDVYLEVKESLYLKDVFVYSDENKLHVDITLNKKQSCSVHLLLRKKEDELWKTIGIHDLNHEKTSLSYEIPDADLWDVDHPVLYEIKIELSQFELIKDEKIISFGFRTAEFKKDGFYLNGEKLKIRGLNRHQSYPYVGYAMPSSMQKLDAKILKEELGCNAVRTSHYPQSQSFIEECDRIGLLVFTEMPGWQHIGDEKWKDQACQNVKDMIMQYRNHPSIILWGVRINESVDDDEFYKRTNAIAHDLDPSRPTGGVRNFKKSHLFEDVYTYNDFVHEGNNRGCEAKVLVTSDMNKAYMVTEYNGHMYPTKAFDNEPHRTSHALRHAKVLNDVASFEDIAGSFGWCMADYHTHQDFGSGDRICYHGVLDMFRNPKMAAAVYASQQDKIPVLQTSSGMEIGEYPASTLGTSYIFTNADSVRMYKNEKFIKEYTVNDSPFKSLNHGPVAVNDLIGDLLISEEGFTKEQSDAVKSILNAVASQGLSHIPVSAAVKIPKLLMKYKMTVEQVTALYTKYIGNWGENAVSYRFDAVKDGNVVKSITRAPMKQTKLDVKADHTELVETHTYDVALVQIRMLDEHDQVLSFSQEPVSLEIEGPVELIGPKLISLHGGMFGTYVKTTGTAGSAKLTVRDSRNHMEVIEFTVTLGE